MAWWKTQMMPAEYEAQARASERLCEREGLEPCETVGVIATALTWPLPKDPMPLLRSFAMAS